MYRDFLEKIFKRFGEEPFIKEIEKAKAEYFGKIGSVFEDDNFFEMRMASFFDWFVFERPMEKVGFTPIKAYYRSNAYKLNEDEKVDLENLLKTIWSVFIVKKKLKEGFRVLDLYDKKKYEVAIDKNYAYIESKNLIEARLIPFRGKYVFSDPIFTHPKEVVSPVKKEAKKLKGSERNEFKEFILQLAHMSIKLHRYKHLPIKEIYKFT